MGVQELPNSRPTLGFSSLVTLCMLISNYVYSVHYNNADHCLDLFFFFFFEGGANCWLIENPKCSASCSQPFPDRNPFSVLLS